MTILDNRGLWEVLIYVYPGSEALSSVICDLRRDICDLSYKALNRDSAEFRTKGIAD